MGTHDATFETPLMPEGPIAPPLDFDTIRAPSGRS